MVCYQKGLITYVMDRPPVDFYFLRMAFLVSERGTCARRKVGCVFVNKRNHVYHGGQYYHTTTHFHLIPESNIGIVLSANTNLLPTYKWNIVREFIKTIN